MRVIRTEIFFSDVGYEPLESSWESRPHSSLEGHNVDFAWFGTGNNSGYFLDFIEPIIFDAHNVVRRFLDIVVQKSELRNFEGRVRSDRIVNRSIVDSLYDAQIVIERSPPEAIPFSQMLKGATAVTIGTMIGVTVPGDNYPLMFVTVPTGIIVVGSAIGISKGLENGLAKGIEKLISRLF